MCCGVLSRLVLPNSLQPHGPQAARLLCPWGFSRQGYWSGLPCPPPGDLPNPGIEPRSPTLQADSLLSEPPGKSMLSCQVTSVVSDSVRPHKTAAHQAPPSLGFSRQEHWSGLPFPSPMHESGKWKVKMKSLSHVRLLATPWTVAYQAPPSMGFSRQEYRSGVPLPSPREVHS